MVKLIQPLDAQVPIVDEQGCPTSQFCEVLQKLAVSSNLQITNGQLDFAAMAAKTILANKTGASASPTACTITDILDFLGAVAQGSIAFRGAAGWQLLAPSTAGKVLQTNGAGADPSWATAAGGGGSGIYNPIINIPTTAGFTLVQGVGGSATMANLSNSRGVLLTITGAGAVDRNALLEKTTPGATWTMTAVILPNVLSRNFVTWGVYVKDSSTGRIQVFCLGVSGGSTARRMNWTNITTFSSSTDESGYGTQGAPTWMKLVLDSTNLTFSTSTDSEGYIQLYQNAKFSWPAAIDRCGIWMGLNQQTAPQNMSETLSVLSFNVA